MTLTVETPRKSAGQPGGARGGARRGRLTTVGVVLVLAGLNLLRARPTSTAFNLWAEDGNIFVSQARSVGFWRALQTTYGGYVHGIPRVVAGIANLFPLRNSPVIFTISAAIGAAVVAVLAAHSGRRIGIGPLGAIALAATFLVMPAAGTEPFNNVTNVQWYCLAGLVAMLAAMTAGHTPHPALAGSLALVVALTTPVAIVLVPWAAAIAWARRDRSASAVFAALAGGVAIQVVAHFRSHYLTHVRIAPARTVRLYLVRVVDGSLTGDNHLRGFSDLVGPVGAIVVGAVLLAALVWAACRGLTKDRPRAVAALATIAASFMIFAQAALLRPEIVAMRNVGFAPAQYHSAMPHGRYMGVPAVCVAMALLIVASTWTTRSGRLLGQIVGALLLVVAVVNFRIGTNRTTTSYWYEQVEAAEARCRTAPPDETLSITIPPSVAPGGWSVTATCHQLFPK